MDERRIVHFDDPGLPADLQVEDRKGRITDPANFADRQRIHDDLGGEQHIHIRTDELQRHRRGHAGQQIRLDTAAETVGKHRQVAVLLLEPLEQEVVSADNLPVVAELKTLHFDENIVRHVTSSP